MPAVNVRDQPAPKGQWLGVGVIDSKDAHTFSDPELDNVPESGPQALCVTLGIEVDVDDILILLGWVFCIAQTAIGAPSEPLWMSGQPGVIRRALDGEVQSNFQLIVTRRGNEPSEIVQVTQLR